MWMAYVHMRMLLAKREIDSARVEYACLYICKYRCRSKEARGSIFIFLLYVYLATLPHFM